MLRKYLLLWTHENLQCIFHVVLKIYITLTTGGDTLRLLQMENSPTIPYVLHLNLMDICLNLSDIRFQLRCLLIFHWYDINTSVKSKAMKIAVVATTLLYLVKCILMFSLCQCDTTIASAIFILEVFNHSMSKSFMTFFTLPNSTEKQIVRYEEYEEEKMWNFTWKRRCQRID